MPSSFVKEAFTGDNRFLLLIAIIAALGRFLFSSTPGSSASPSSTSSSTCPPPRPISSGSCARCCRAMVGAASPLAVRPDRRKWTKFTSGCVYLVGGLSAFAPGTEWLLASRFVLARRSAPPRSSPSSTSPSKHPRGCARVTSFNQLMVTTGILVAYLVAAGFQDVSGTWRWMLGLSVVPVSRWRSACSPCPPPHGG